ncbi:sensor histidine kinase [Flavobacterium algicola]|uniref:sensor histidine kinase n=1 Tax=Flavobacterium algicola TaxID=556529 RepID=UPI001EFED6E2|nr:ATP-binding protein [Flavobacterium algicola]MCG9790987.1 ATP-binding protein [Flavobacterium algicola]
MKKNLISKIALPISPKDTYAKKLVFANMKLALQIKEGIKRAKELALVNKELAFQNEEKERRAAELAIANKELAFQNQEKENRAAELAVANRELAFQNQEKENRASELAIANEELAFQNQEKEKRAAELVIANEELLFQNKEKENRAAELAIANKELLFQNQEKEKRAAELVLANEELAFQNQEKEKRASELLIANKELEAFTYISSHDLQEPLRKIQTFSSRILSDELQNLSTKGKHSFERIQHSAFYMQTLIKDLLAYSRTTAVTKNFIKSDLKAIIKEALETLEDEIQKQNASIVIDADSECEVIPFQFRQLLQNLIGNSLKFHSRNNIPHIIIHTSYISKNDALHLGLPQQIEYCHLKVSDNGLGFDAQYSDKIFEIFQRLHNDAGYEGTGIGLTIAKKIIENHNGIIKASGVVDKGAVFDIYIPTHQS